MSVNVQSGMPRLIANLKRVKDSSEVSKALLVDGNGKFWLDKTNVSVSDVSVSFSKMVDEIFEDLNEWLIADNGFHDVPNRETLNRLGYRFEEGTEDEFGVITAIIVVSDFSIEYGEKVHA